MMDILKHLYKYFFLLLLLNILLLGTGYFLVSAEIINSSFSDIAILSLAFSVIVLIALIIFFRGQTRDPAVETMHSIVSVSLKFLLELGLALIWFLVAKKTSLASVIIFFVLYLSLTLFLTGVILKTLKTRFL
ncbi:MAG: hypothetical protein LLG13_06770 [Bacteroidales bacterium]|nr:hypothetical protein [Bacteroidales bacterium]